MHETLSRNVFVVKEHVGMFKAANNYDIFDAGTGQLILECREPSLGFFTKLLRFTAYKRNTPFDVHITTPGGEPVIRVARGVSIFLSQVRVFDEGDEEVGGFKQKLWSVGGKFDVLDAQDNVLCSLKGSWTGWDFRFLAGDREFAHVTKKWAGAGKELFTTADNYVLEIDRSVPADNPVRELIMAAVMCIDMVIKE